MPGRFYKLAKVWKFYCVKYDVTNSVTFKLQTYLKRNDDVFTIISTFQAGNNANTYDYGDTCTFFISRIIKGEVVITPFRRRVRLWLT